MKQLVDIVNFNADGSCVAAERWLSALHGGRHSELCAWLDAYVATGSKVAIGFIGGTLADVATLNPEAIAVVNEHPELFDVLVRPFAHDIALLRGNVGFRLNLELGQRAIEREFQRVVRWYLPPEFMLTNRQLATLAEVGVEGVFINPGRFEAEVQGRLPRLPYLVSGVAGLSMRCVPFERSLTEAYLRTIQRLDPQQWMTAAAGIANDVAYVWRDGESVLLVPDGVERERFWLDTVRDGGERLSLSEAVRGSHFLAADELAPAMYKSYPVHSFAAWMKEFRMLGYLRALDRYEDRLEAMTLEQRVLWLQTINSDVLSAVEKASPSVQIRSVATREPLEGHIDHRILRTERGFEGEEYLHLLESLDTPATRRHIRESNAPHMIKLRARLAYAERLLG